MERQPERTDSSRSETIVEARTSLALWLRTGRAQRGMSLDDVAKVTKIQSRILERLEAGKLEGLPADVFVRGFVRSFARCVGLDEVEALRRYASCGLSGGLAVGTTDLTPTARALVDAMTDLVPGRPTSARATPRKMLAVVPTAVEAEAVASTGLATSAMMLPAPVATEPTAAHELAAAPEPAASAMEVASEPPAVESTLAPEETVSPAVAVDSLSSSPSSSTSSFFGAPAAPLQASQGSSKKKRGRRNKARRKKGLSGGASPIVGQDVGGSGRWAPTMPALGAVLSAWRKPVYAGPATAAPCLVIDDADPDSAERILEERAETQAPRRSFLPPILLDREDRSARQGGLTLAVIILLIAATLTLSYLMRRPSASGDGMTQLATPASHAG